MATATGRTRYRTHNGVRQKRCTGPLHPTGGAWLPLDRFWKYGENNKYKSGLWFYRCIECMKLPKRFELGEIYSAQQRMIIRRYKKVSRHTFKTEKGILYKRCVGPAHDEPTWLPAENKYFYLTKRGTLYNRCRLCCAWAYADIPQEAGFIPLSKAQGFFKEAVARVGMMETARRIDLTDTQLRKILRGKPQYVRKSTFKRLMIELVSMRRKNEVRHRLSIHHGSAQRGRPEKVPTKRKHLYKPHGDADAQLKRKSRS